MSWACSLVYDSSIIVSAGAFIDSRDAWTHYIKRLARLRKLRLLVSKMEWIQAEKNSPQLTLSVPNSRFQLKPRIPSLHNHHLNCETNCRGLRTATSAKDPRTMAHSSTRNIVGFCVNCMLHRRELRLFVSTIE